MHGAVMVVELVSLRMLKSKLLECTRVSHSPLPGISSSDLKIIQVRRECATIHKINTVNCMTWYMAINTSMEIIIN